MFSSSPLKSSQSSYVYGENGKQMYWILIRYNGVNEAEYKYSSQFSDFY